MFAEPRIVTRLEECFFYHTLELPGFGVVQGDWDLRDCFDDYIGHVDLKGKRVLDIGTASGFLTFEAEKRGAELVSFDIADASTQSILPFCDKLHYTDFKEWVSRQSKSYEPMKNAYWLAHRLYGSKARVHYGNICALPAELGKFDVVFIGSVTEHLQDQIAALTSISRLAADTIVINSPLLPIEDKLAYFLPSAGQPENDYTWWVYSLGIYREVFGMLGFGIEKVLPVTCLHTASGSQPRTTLVARRAASGQQARGALRRIDPDYREKSTQPPSSTNAAAGGLPPFMRRIAYLESELGAARAKLAELESLGSVTLGLAGRWRRMADRHPRAAALLKPIARSFSKLVS